MVDQEFRPPESPNGSTETPPAPRLLDMIRARMRRANYALRTERAYTDWIRRFILANGKRHPAEMGEGEMESFLSELAVTYEVVASTRIRRWRRCFSCIATCWESICPRCSPLSGPSAPDDYRSF